MEKALRETNLADIGTPKRGKVRDVYDLGDSLLIVASDRLSAFDVVLPTGIPDKGKVLTKLSVFWFGQMEDIVKNHILEVDAEKYPDVLKKYMDDLRDRSMLVRKAQVIPIECVVRGYLSGSGWNDYKKTGTICGMKLPEGLVESAKLEHPIFTPTTKAEEGHDMNISYEELVNIVGDKLAQKLHDLSIKVYEKGCEIAESKGIIIADTKFEFGMIDDEIIIVDEMLTPILPGSGQENFTNLVERRTAMINRLSGITSTRLIGTKHILALNYPKLWPQRLGHGILKYWRY